MANLEIFKQQEVLGRDFKIYGTPESPLFLAKDVAEWIDYSKSGNGSYNITQMLGAIDESEKLTLTMLVGGQNRDVLMVTEDGLYEILMLSRKPIAKEFKGQVKIIMKSIRKNGMYAKDELLDDPDLLLDVVSRLKRERDLRLQYELENKAHILQIETMKPKADFADRLLKSNDNLLVREYAKVLQDEGFNLGEKKLYNWLRDNEYLMKNNEPYQAYMKYFVVKESTYDTGYKIKINKTSKINPDGQLYFFKKLSKEFGLISNN